MMGGGMHGFWGLGGLGWPGIILGWIINLGLVVGLVLLITWLVRRTMSPGRDGQYLDGGAARDPDPLEILKTRYARGEINRDQYRAMLADLND